MKRFWVLLCLVFTFLVPMKASAAGINIVSSSFHDGLAVIEENGKYGYICTDGTIAIQPQWEDARAFNEGLAAIKVKGKYGFIDKTGTIVVKPKWDAVSDYQNGFAAVKKRNKWGFVDTAGNIVSKTKWDDYKGFACGVGAVKKKDKWSFIDTTGNLIGKAKWSNVSSHSNNIASVYDGAHWGYVDTNGELIIQPQYVSCEPFSEELAWVAVKDVKGKRKYGAINIKGETVIDFIYDSVDILSEGYVIAEQGEERYLVDKSGKKIFNAELSSFTSYISQSVALSTSSFYEHGLFQIHKLTITIPFNATYKYGLCDINRKIIVEPEWDSMSRFSEGMAFIRNTQGKYGYINANGTVVIKPQYDDAGSFSDGVAIVWKGNTWYIIDKTGKIVF